MINTSHIGYEKGSVPFIDTLTIDFDCLQSMNFRARLSKNRRWQVTIHHCVVADNLT